MKNMFRSLGVMVSTGAMAIFGMIIGTIAFSPNNVTITKNNETTNNEESK